MVELGSNQGFRQGMRDPAGHWTRGREELRWGAGDGGEQEGVRQPGGAAPHDDRHPCAAAGLPVGLLGPGAQGAPPAWQLFVGGFAHFQTKDTDRR